MARSGSPAKSKSTAVIVDDSKKKSVDAVSTTTTTTTTTTVTVVDEETAVAASSKEESTKEDSNEEGKRELPIFNNPLLADEKSSAVALKPKGGRVKVQGGKTATIAVLKMSAPKTDGEVVVMRRMDSNLVNATLMFQAAFPAATEQWITKENSYLTKTYVPHGAVVEGSESGASLAGVWYVVCCLLLFFLFFNWVYRKRQEKDEDGGHILPFQHIRTERVSIWVQPKDMDDNFNDNDNTQSYKRKNTNIVNTHRAIGLFFLGLYSTVEQKLCYLLFFSYDACCRSISIVVSCF